MATESSTKVFTTTTVFQHEKVAEGEWKITEIKSDPPPQLEAHSMNRKKLQFDIAFGIGIAGYYDLDDEEVSVTTTFGGSPFGERYTVGLNSGLTLGIDVWAAKGSIRIFKENNQLKLAYTLESLWSQASDTIIITDL